MKKMTALLVTILHKMAEPRNVRVFMFLLPLVNGAATGGQLNEVGGNAGGCTAG